MPEAGGGARLSELEARWRTDRSPRVFLQLADELRRAGANERAVRVLQEGLSHHPDSVSGRVALGRLQLEQGDPHAAAESLERALARDPAQIVASKLLIEAWIAVGDATRARERLDLYRIFQQRDGEIEEYERTISAMERSERHAALEAVPADGDAPAPGADAPIFAMATVAPLPELDLAASLGAADERSPGRTLDLDAPFGTIHDPVAGEARIYDYLAGETIFGATRADLASGAAGAVDLGAIESGLGVELAGAEPRATESAESAEDAALEVEPEPEPLVAFERYSTLGFAEEVERDTLEEPLARVLARAEAETTPAEAESAEAVEASAAEPLVDPAAAVQPSATLAGLYLEQGHLVEAEAEFRRVLAGRPDDEAALTGLREIGRRRSADETVSGWSAPASSAASALSPPRPLRPAGLTQRKIETLRDYLERIRRGRARSHVS